MSPLVSSMMLSSVAAGTIIAASTHHWLLAWMGLELNTLAILPLLATSHTPRAIEATTKYFLIQAAASSMLLFASILNANLTGQWDITQLTTQPAITMLTLALMMKLGLAPMHAWLPEVMQGTPTQMAFIMATWQKLAPSALLLQTAHTLHTPTILSLALLSTLIGGWGGLNQTQLRKLLAFSSIAHLGWMMSIITMNTDLMLLTLTIYIIMTTTMFSIILTSHTKSLKDMTMMSSINPTMMILALLTLISLGGLPPLSGFAPKWLILTELTTWHLPAMATLMALASLLSLAFYIRLGYLTSLIIAPNTNMTKLNWRLKPNHPTLTTTLTTTLTMMLLPITPLLLLT
uniref:NADH-ubiquinone oxidoreductase chain 2 n=1 Tax=Diplometopon zarudnyi TaxID=94420 RepID=Q66SX8_DIPZA|nr:NADH dehydrogenase subunit 2 [Diplometopon zarudnyi]AAT08504.1 NADH dehydrogenase subunit 2 [Diplometopon zarudnyi]